jgi:hypothetical protein
LLCRLVYGVEQVEKKHRVSVLRALRTLVSRGLIPIAGWVPEFEKNDVEWFNFRIIGLPTRAFVLGESRRFPGTAAKSRRAGGRTGGLPTVRPGVVGERSRNATRVRRLLRQ